MSWASVGSPPAGAAPPSDVLLRSTLVVQVEQLQDCLKRVGSFLERAEAALSKLSPLPNMLKTTPMSCPPSEVGVGSADDGAAELYGCYSPRVGNSSLSLTVLSSAPATTEGEASATVVAPVLQIMPDLEELCASTALPVSVEQVVKVDSPETLSLPERLDVVSEPIPPSPSHNSDALFAKELCDLLSAVEVAIPGCGRAIACLLTGTTTKGKSKIGDCPRSSKEKSLRCKGKKSGTVGKVPAAT